MTDDKISVDGTPVYQTRFDPVNPATLPETIVFAIASVMETPPLELPPLNDRIDLEALAAFVEHATEHSGNVTASIEFSLETWNILVRCDGSVVISESSSKASTRDDASGQRTPSESD